MNTILTKRFIEYKDFFFIKMGKKSMYRIFIPDWYVFSGCETYGNTFEIYTQHHLLGNDDDVRACDSLDTCKQYCISALFLCRSFERNNHTAWYSKENALTNPENYTKAGGLVEIYYYNRNCAK